VGNEGFASMDENAVFALWSVSDKQTVSAALHNALDSFFLKFAKVE
jgi:hypothetical protein